MLKNLRIGKKITTSSITEAKREAPQEVAQADIAEGQSVKLPPQSHQPMEQVLEEQLNISSPPHEEATTHFDDLIEGANSEEVAQEQAIINNSLVPRDEWCRGFIAIHGIGATFTGIQSIALPNSQINIATAQEVAETFYDMILEVPMLHFMLQPGGKWLGRIFVVGAYARGMSVAVGTEMRERREISENKNSNFSDAKRATKPREDGEPDASQVAALTGA